MATITDTFDAAFQHHQAGQLGRAEELYRKVLQVNPQHADCHHLLGLLAHQQGQVAQAVASIKQALVLNPMAGVYHCNLGVVHEAAGQTEDAILCYQQAIRLQPDYAEAHFNLGFALAKQGHFDEAVVRYREAIRLKPDYAEAASNMANALVGQGNLERAIAHYREALRLKPNFAAAASNMANAFAALGKLEEAMAGFSQALRIRPDFAEARLGRVLLMLLHGKWAEGWSEYEWRLRTDDACRVTFRQPRWDGSPLCGRAILLAAEQGLGDTLQFVRYLPLVERAGGRVIMQCQRALKRLLTHCLGHERVVAKGEPLPPFDVYAPLLSLPGIMGTTVASVPAQVPYLGAEPGLVEQWRRELEPIRGLKVGIAWQGNPNFKYDRHRSIPLRHFSPLAQAAGVQLISLQKHEKGVGTPVSFSVLDFGTRLDEAAGPFMDTAAIMKNLDLVISSDTAVAHLAGALGVPVWVALPLVPDWRWLLQRADSPWYTTMRLFRQSRYGDWDGVFDRMAAELTSGLRDKGTR